MDPPVDLLLWRSSLPHAPAVPDAYGQLRAAEMCRAAGLNEQARMLHQAASLQAGFSPQALARRAATPAQGTTVEIAIAELADVSRTVAGRLAASLAGDAGARTPGTAEPAEAGDLAELVDALCRFLAEPAPAAGWDGGEALVARLRDVGGRAAQIDYRAYAAAPLPLLAAALGLAVVQDFVLRNHGLLFAPFGSAEFLHRAARFDGAGLGPYFTNVPQIARRSRDVFELADLARRAGIYAGRGEVAVDHWVVLLSQQLTGALRNEVVDDLGDRGAMAALAAIFAQAARQRDDRIEIDLVMRLRDAALDNGDYDLAARAQALVAQLRPGNLLERQILGSIDGTTGRIMAAEQSFLECLRIAPDDTATAERLVALRAGRFEPFAIRHGFGTPQDRLLTRLRRRRIERVAAPAAAARRTAAVEL